METVLVANPQVVYSLGTIQTNMIAVPVEISPKLDRAEIITNKTKGHVRPKRSMRGHQ